MKISEYKKLTFDTYSPSVKKESKKRQSILDYEITIFPFRLKDRAKEAFYVELSTLFSAGLDIRSSLELLIGERKDKHEKQLLQTILTNLINGNSFAASLEGSKQFSPYEYYSVQIGEESGKLSIVLTQLAQYYIAKSKQRRKIISALSYPIMILLTAIAAVGFMLTFIVPMFKDVFSRFGGELPLLTRQVIALSEVVTESFSVFFLFFILSAAAFIYSRRFERSRRIYSQITSKIPLIGKLITTIHLSTFCSSMSLLIGAKIPLLTALNLLQKMVPFYPIRDSLEVIRKKVLFGESLHSSMTLFTIYDKKMLALIKVGEEVNKLDYFFGQLSLQYNQDLEHQTTLLGTFLEPLIIVFLGVVVAFILIAMYLPMFQMSNQIGV